MSATSAEDNPVDAVKDLLQNADTSVFTGDKPPVIERVFERTPQARENELRDAIYLWQPTNGDIERVTADGDLLFRENTIEVYVYILENEARAIQLREDLISFFANYIDDNKENTQFNDVQPTSDIDNRPNNLPGDTSHHIAGLELDLNKRQSVA